MLTCVLSLLFAAPPSPAQSPPASDPSRAKGPAAKGEHAQNHHGHQHDFKDTQKWVAMFEDPARAAWQKPAEVVAALHIPAGARVADIGAGSGYFTMPFARAVGESGVAYGVDVDQGMVAHLKARAEKEKAPMLKAVLAAPDDPNLPAPVDLVFICDTWHHIQDRPAYLKRLKASLKPGARLVMVDFQKRSLPLGPPPEMKISEEDLVKELDAEGYRLAEKHDFLPYQYFLVFQVK